MDKVKKKSLSKFCFVFLTCPFPRVLQIPFNSFISRRIELQLTFTPKMGFGWNLCLFVLIHVGGLQPTTYSTCLKTFNETWFIGKLYNLFSE